MKKFIFILTILLVQKVFCQPQSRNHYESSFAIEGLATLGKNNIGTGAMMSYYIADEQHIRLGGIMRYFNYKDYSENIIEASIDYGYTFFAPSRYSRTFRNFSFTGIGGLAVEVVKVKSEVTLIEDYPKYKYVYLGANSEFSLSDTFSLSLTGRQFYAINGKKETLGNYRYDIFLSLKYYFY